MHSIIRTLAAVSALFALCAGAPAQVMSPTINLSADAFVTSALPNSNYGNAGAGGVSAAGLPKGQFNTLMRFDPTPARTAFDTAYGAGNWTVQSISLRLTSTPPNNPIFNGNGAGPGGTNVNTAGLFTVSWMPDDSWLEGSGTPAAPGSAPDVTFNNQPLATGDQALGTFNFPGGTSGNNTYILSSSAGVQLDVATPSLPSLRLTPADASVAYLFNSRSGASPPQITITASPEPAALGLLVAMASLALTSRRRA